MTRLAAGLFLCAALSPAGASAAQEEALTELRRAAPAGAADAVGKVRSPAGKPLPVRGKRVTAYAFDTKIVIGGLCPGKLEGSFLVEDEPSQSEASILRDFRFRIETEFACAGFGTRIIMSAPVEPGAPDPRYSGFAYWRRDSGGEEPYELLRLKSPSSAGPPVLRLDLYCPRGRSRCAVGWLTSGFLTPPAYSDWPDDRIYAKDVELKADGIQSP